MPVESEALVGRTPLSEGVGLTAVRVELKP